MELLEQKDSLGFQELQVIEVLQEEKVHPEGMVLMASLDCLVLKEKRVPWASLVHLGGMVDLV
jgi:hypothetical protein